MEAVKFKVGDRVVHWIARTGAVVEVHEDPPTYWVRFDDAVRFTQPIVEEELHTEAEDPRRALFELAQAASLVVAEYDSWVANDLIPAGFILGEDVERLRARLTEHMPAIEAAQK